MELIDEFNEVRECVYKDERYSVRDNGAVMRHAKNENRPRKLDCVWTFGEKNEKTGYMTIGAARVHIIVATAFHGSNDSKKLVVDHIDTNRCNNRPENLRWITRLENVLLNPATRKKVAYLCGSIENFINDPSCLRDVTGTNQDVSWMRTVSGEEAKLAYENVMRWARYEKPGSGGRQPVESKDPDWMFKKHPEFDFDGISSVPQSERIYAEQEKEDPYVRALSPSVAVQLNWRIPSEFPCCPETVDENTLRLYAARLVKDEIFARNDIYASKVVEAALYDEGRAIAVWTAPVASDGMKMAVSKVYIADGKVVHETEGTYFSEDGARKYYTLLQGLEWTGGDVFDDFC